MSYYKTINGVRYDRQLLERADFLTDGRGDGRISLADIKLLYEETQDRGTVTEIEEQTLLYIRDNYALTTKALHWLRERLPNDGQNLEIVIQKILDELDVPELEWDIEEFDIEEQEKLNDGVTFEEALYAALNSFIRDGETAGSPQDVVLGVHPEIREENFDSIESFYRALRKQIRYYMNKGGLVTLLPLDMYELEEEELGDLNPPEGQESIEDNWIFSLYLPELSDHTYWAILDRSGRREVYNYGFN